MNETITCDDHGGGGAIYNKGGPVYNKGGPAYNKPVPEALSLPQDIFLSGSCCRGKLMMSLWARHASTSQWARRASTEDTRAGSRASNEDTRAPEGVAGGLHQAEDEPFQSLREQLPVGWVFEGNVLGQIAGDHVHPPWDELPWRRPRGGDRRGPRGGDAAEVPFGPPP